MEYQSIAGNFQGGLSRTLSGSKKVHPSRGMTIAMMTLPPSQLIDGHEETYKASGKNASTKCTLKHRLYTTLRGTNICWAQPCWCSLALAQCGLRPLKQAALHLCKTVQAPMKVKLCVSTLSPNNHRGYSCCFLHRLSWKSVSELLTLALRCYNGYILFYK